MPTGNTDFQSNTSATGGGGSASPDFRLQYTVEGGQKFGNGLSQWMSALSIQGGATPRALMLVTRYNGDLMGRPVGLFSDSLAPLRVRRLVERLDAVASGALPAGGGDPGASTPRLYYQHGPRIISVGFDPRDQAFLNAIGPAMGDLTDLMSDLIKKPERAVTVSVERSEDAGRGLRLRLRLTNVGSGEVIVADPRMASRISPEPRAFLQVTPMPVRVPGQVERPPSWRRIGLEPPPPDVPDEGLTIKPKESITFLSASWTPPTPSDRYVVQAIWQDYYGPAKIDPEKVQPAIPKEAAPSDKPFVLRGAAFSSYLLVAIAENVKPGMSPAK